MAPFVLKSSKFYDPICRVDTLTRRLEAGISLFAEGFLLENGKLERNEYPLLCF